MLCFFCTVFPRLFSPPLFAQPLQKNVLLLLQIIKNSTRGKASFPVPILRLSSAGEKKKKKLFSRFDASASARRGPRLDATPAALEPRYCNGTLYRRFTRVAARHGCAVRQSRSPDWVRRCSPFNARAGFKRGNAKRREKSRRCNKMSRLAGRGRGAAIPVGHTITIFS